jgi:hypothetical protein
MEQYSEFAVYVSGKGYVIGSKNPPYFTRVGVDNEPDVFTDAADAKAVASKVADQYSRLGLNELADRVEVLTRVVTVTRDQWCETNTPNLVREALKRVHARETV